MSKRQREVEEDREDLADPKNQAENELPEVEDDLDAGEERAREPEDDEDDERLAHVDGEEDDHEPERLSRRRRRNRARRQRMEEADQTITALVTEIQNLKGQMTRVSGAQIGLAAQDIDAQLVKLQGDLETIRAAQARAVKDSDDELFQRSKRLEEAAQARAQELLGERQRLAYFARQQEAAAIAASQPQPPSADPVATKFARKFMAENPWFDPNDASDEDSNIAKAIDTALVNEGYAPNTQRFWREFERRCAARGLGQGDDEDDMSEDDDNYAPPRRERRDNGLPPRGRSSGSGAPRASAGGFRLTPLMRDALEAEGLTDEKNLTKEQRSYRERLIKTWKTNLAAAERR